MDDQYSIIWAVLSDEQMSNRCSKARRGADFYEGDLAEKDVYKEGKGLLMLLVPEVLSNLKDMVDYSIAAMNIL